LRIYVSDMIPDGLGLRTFPVSTKSGTLVEEDLVNKEMEKYFSPDELQEFLAATDALPSDVVDKVNADGTVEKTRSFQLIRSLWQLLTAGSRSALAKKVAGTFECPKVASKPPNL
jgi:hypothetical protein